MLYLTISSIYYSFTQLIFTQLLHNFLPFHFPLITIGPDRPTGTYPIWRSGMLI